MNKRLLCIPALLVAAAAPPALATTLIPISNPLPIGVIQPVPTATVSTGPTTAQWQALYNATSATTQFRIPSDMPVAAPLVPGQLVTAKYAPFASPLTVTKNNAYGLLSTLIASAQANEALGFQITPSANTAPKYPQYETDGNAVSSCDEYVYKKYYDYRRFQDAAATCGGSPDCVYNLWASTAVPGEDLWMAPKSGQATVMSPYPTSTLDPNPLVATQTGSQQQLKNPFRDPANVSDFVNALAFATEGTGSSGVTPYGVVSGYLTGSAFTSSSPYYTIQGARMPWHVQMHNQQAGYGMTMLDRSKIAQRTANMQSLLAAYRNAYAMDMQNFQFWESRVEALCGGLFKSIHPCTPTNPCPVLPPPSAACTQVRNEDPGMPNAIKAGTALGDALVAEYANTDRVTGAVDNGCLGTNHNKCDWSPTMIGQEYLTTLDAQVAADLSTCDGTLGTAPATTLNAIQSNATTDEVSFGQALVKEAAQASAARSSLSWSQSANDTIHYDLFGGPQSWGIGGSVASANYSQSAFWEVKGEKNTSGALCRVSGRLVGSANGGGAVFGDSFTLLDADVNVGVGERTADASDYSGYEIESHLTIAGYSVYDVPETLQTGNLNETLGNLSYTDTVLDVLGQISWVSIDLKVNVVAQLNATFTATAPGACSSVTDPTKNVYSLSANVTPSITAQAVGTALVGALGTGVGIQGTVDVLTASLPITVGSAIGPGTDGNVDMTLDANASLSLNVLSGELDTAECFLGDCATQELFKWNGIPAYSDVLWNTSDQFPILVMQSAFK